MFKIVIFCVSTLYIQSITCNCIRNPLNTGIIGPSIESMAYGSPMAYAAEYANPWTYDNYGLNLATLAASNGCGFTVQSSSPIAPNGVSILSENMVIEGPLAVNGQMPFLGTIGLEGSLPASGAGVVSYGGGNGNVGIINEGLSGYNMAGPYGMAGMAPGMAGMTTGMAGMAGMTPGMAGLGIGMNNAMYGGFGGIC